MTTREISDRFDSAVAKLYGGLSMNEYEKSIVLSKAQSFFVDKILKIYEYGDAIRHILGKLIVEKELTPSDVLFTGDGYIKLPIEVDIRQILFERTNVSIETIPMDYNDIHDTLGNPFREPNSKIAYRVTGDNIISLYTSEAFVKYFYVYCKEPVPIVLETLPYGLKVGNTNTETTSELPDESVLKIIEIAANLSIKEVTRLAPKEQPEKK